MNFKESEAYLLSLGNEVSAMKLGLESISRVLDELSRPEDRYLKVQIAGTNGKGSVCAFLDGICRSARIKTGLYTSPHLVSITERVKVGGKDLSQDDFARYATQVRAVCEQLVERGDLESVLTFFEQVTAIALRAFADNEVELAILETGLGGRLDATTAAHAQIAAITQIDFDHQEILGETITAIAAEKAAIIRPNSSVVVGEQSGEAMRVILEACNKSGVGPRLASEVRIRVSPVASEGRTPSQLVGFLPKAVDFFTGKAGYEGVKLGLLGRHQIANAKVGILLAEILQEHFEITAAEIVQGLETAKHPGRLELCGRYLFDGAHNLAGARALRSFLNETIRQRVTLIFGSMRDKDVAEIAEILFPGAETLILTRPDNTRSMSSEEIAKFVPNGYPKDHVVLTDSVAKAIAEAEEIAGPNGLICVTGSLYLVGAAKQVIAGSRV